MASSYTTANLLESVKRLISVPSYQGLNTDGDILDIATEELHSHVTPMITSLRQEYFVQESDDIAITIDQTKYPIPVRTSTRTVKDVLFKASSTAEPFRLNFMPRNLVSQGVSVGKSYYIQGDEIVLTWTPSQTSGFLVILFEVTPSRLIQTTEAGQVTAIDTGTGEITLANVPTTFTTSVDYDFINGKSGNWFRALDQTCSSVVSSVLTFSSLPSTLAVGDWVAISNETPILQIPQELMPYLAQRTATKILQGVGDYEALQISEKISDEKMKDAQRLLTPRIEAARQKVVNVNGLLRGRRSFARRTQIVN